MSRPFTRHRWLAVLLAVAGVSLAGAAVAGAARAPLADHRPAGVTVTPTQAPVEAAVVPARTEIAPGRAHQSPGRFLLPLVVALVTLAGLLGLGARRSAPPEAGPPPLVGRRRAIGLRAPPSLQLV
jgi:ABC-type Fe3+-siderophore transport system permease subunit